MAGPKHRVETADLDAAAWHARLGDRNVSTETLDAFFAWRARPGNADAYARVERVWTGSGRLAGDPAMAAALEGAMGRRRPKRRFGGATTVVTGLVVAGLGVALAGSWLWRDMAGVFETGVGEQREVVLADGSRVRLDTDSRVRVRMTAEGRRVALERGQALFTVARDAGRPFVVAAGATEVTAIGTVFDVRREAAEVRVTLVSGVVEVDGGGEAAPARMTAGHQGRVTARTVEVRRADVAAATGWTEGRIVFRDTPLATAVAEVNRYLDDGIVLAPGAPGRTAVNGVFRTGDRDAFVSAAAAGLGLRATEEPDGTVILAPR